MHEDGARFAELDLGDAAAGTFEVRTSGQDLVITGKCGRCKASTSFTIVEGVVVGGSTKGWRRKAVSLPEATIFCACGFAHEGRPEGSDENGCGAYWRVQIAVPHG